MVEKLGGVFTIVGAFVPDEALTTREVMDVIPVNPITQSNTVLPDFIMIESIALLLYINQSVEPTPIRQLERIIAAMQEQRQTPD